MSWPVVVFAALCMVFVLIALSMISTWSQNIYIARATGIDPRHDSEAAKAAAEQVRRSKS